MPSASAYMRFDLARRLLKNLALCSDCSHERTGRVRSPTVNDFIEGVNASSNIASNRARVSF